MSKFSELYGGGKPKPSTVVTTAPAEAASELAPAGEGYAGYDFNRNGRPVMGFHIAHKDGNLDGFMYHSINHPKFQIRDGQEFLSFTYSGTAVVMTGTRLKLIFEALMRHTLKAIYEEDGRRPISTDTPIVTRISIKQAVPKRIESSDGLELVKPARHG